MLGEEYARAKKPLGGLFADLEDPSAKETKPVGQSENLSDAASHHIPTVLEQARDKYRAGIDKGAKTDLD